jgi:hypothetical protein
VVGQQIARAMFLDGDHKALRAYHAGDRGSDIAASYFVGAGLTSKMDA